MLAVRSVGRFAAPLLLACSSLPVRAQSLVTAASGDPAAIQRIRRDVGAIDRNVKRYRLVERDIDNVSTDGGHLTAYFDGNDLRKLEVGLFGEQWRKAETYYFAHGAPFFILDEYGPGYARREPAPTIVNRLYVDGGVVIRHIVTGSEPEPDDPGTYSADPADFTSWLAFYQGCVAARDSDASECSAPDSLSVRSGTPSVEPAAVVRQRALYDDIEHRLPSLRHASADMHTLTLAGTVNYDGVLDAYCDGDSIRLLVADYATPSARATIRMYFVHDSLFFLYRHATRRASAKAGRAAVHDGRWYFTDDRLVRWVDDDNAVSIAPEDRQAEFWLGRARDLRDAMPACRPRLREVRE